MNSDPTFKEYVKAGGPLGDKNYFKPEPPTVAEDIKTAVKGDSTTVGEDLKTGFKNAFG